jgi:S1-C subfamily serine protease
MMAFWYKNAAGASRSAVAVVCTAWLLLCSACGGLEAGTPTATATNPPAWTEVCTAILTPTDDPKRYAEPTPTMTFRRALIQAQMATVAVGKVVDGIDCSPLGSGTVIDCSGLIVTGAHVVSDCDVYCLSCTKQPDTQPYRCYSARVIKRDQTLDLTLLQVETGVDGSVICDPILTDLPSGDSNMVRTGDTIYVLGYPDVGDTSVTVTRDMVAGFESNRPLIKTDAEFSSGSSGGPAITENGSLVGIPVKVRAQGTGKLGYLIVVNEVRRFLD